MSEHLAMHDAFLLRPNAQPRYTHEYFIGFLGDNHYRDNIQKALVAYEFIPPGHQVTFFDKAESHGWQSSAVNLVEEPLEPENPNSDVVLVSFMAKGSKSSQHLHNRAEWYRQIAGDGELILDGRVSVPKTETLVIPPLHFHQAEARGGWVLTAIRMIGGAEHIPVIEV